jgi:hypothetical protein
MCFKWIVIIVLATHGENYLYVRTYWARVIHASRVTAVSNGLRCDKMKVCSYLS